MSRNGLIAISCALLALGAPAAVFADSVSYTYDVFGRVLTATYSTGVTVTYAYDAAGNRTSKVITGGSGGTNHPPVANDDSGEAIWSSTSPMCGKPSVTIAVLANDSDPDGDPITITATSAALSGTVTHTATTVTYTYGTNVCSSGGVLTYIDSDSFTYTISDGRGGTATANVNITIESM
jgi:YD repeat-containing protein